MIGLGSSFLKYRTYPPQSLKLSLAKLFISWLHVIAPREGNVCMAVAVQLQTHGSLLKECLWREERKEKCDYCPFHCEGDRHKVITLLATLSRITGAVIRGVFLYSTGSEP